MPKRKRDGASSVEDLFYKFRKDVFQALKTAKGFERQRLSKRINDARSTPDKIQRLEREILVLKSLDLEQAAQAHLCSALLKLKPVSESSDLPAAIRDGVPRPQISEEERAALHNVTSALYNRKEIRSVVESAISAICEALGVSVPQKKGRGSSRPLGGDLSHEKQQHGVEEATGPERESGEPRAKHEGRRDNDTVKANKLASPVEVEEEAAFAGLDDLIGASSDDEEEGGASVSAERDPMEVSLDEDSLQEESESSEAESAGSGVPRPQPKSQSRQSAQARASASTFLPTLMGGYISGSESEASDIDVAPPMRKNRRGQQARRAIWEKKYGESANHVRIGEMRGAKSRDDGWDLKRGAVDSAGGSSKPWKRGIRNPMEPSRGAGSRVAPEQVTERVDAVRKHSARDDAGTLHPSWEAKKKAKEKETKVVFQGKKTVF